MMNTENSDFVPLKDVKLEHNTNDYYNNNEYLIEDEPKINLVPKVEIKCKNKCFDIVDKWIARVVVNVPTGNNWHNIVAREVAILKVRYPFLTEQQLRGRALMKFGIPSMCGSVVRTGNGKVTSAIAKELSLKNDKRRRIPAAFKVLKHFLRCMNKFEAKSVTNMWIQENQRIPTLYNRETSDCTKKIVQTKTKVKTEKMERNYWGPSERQSLVINPVNKLEPPHPSPNTRIIHNISEQISCAALTPKKEQPLIPRRKALLSKFNDIDMTIFTENNIIEQERTTIKQEITSPDSKECLRIIANDFKENLCYNHGEHETPDHKGPKQKMQTYSQLSEESRDIWAHFQDGSQTQKQLGMNKENYQKQVETHPTNKLDTIFGEIDSDITESKPGNSSYSYRKQLFSDSSVKRCGNKRSISYQREILSPSVSVLNHFPSCSPARSSSQGIKRRYSESINFLSPPRKNVKHNSDHHFQDILLDNTKCDQDHQLFAPRKISMGGFDEPSQSEIQYDENAKCSSANTFFEPTPFSGKLSSIGGNGNLSGILLPRQNSAPSYFKSLSTPNTQFSCLSAPRSSGGSFKYLWDDMNSQNFSCKNFTNSQESRTTCTLTPDIAEMLSEIDNTPRSTVFQDISRQMSPDLLDRENIAQFSFVNSISTSNVNGSSSLINHNAQPNIRCQIEKPFMLSDFCSEYDNGWKRLIRKTQELVCVENILKEQTTFPIARIKLRIEKAIRILDENIGNIVV